MTCCVMKRPLEFIRDSTASMLLHSNLSSGMCHGLLGGGVVMTAEERELARKTLHLTQRGKRSGSLECRSWFLETRALESTSKAFAPGGS